MKKYYITYTQGEKKKKAVLDENMLKAYRENELITELAEYNTELLMERAYAEISSKIGQRKTLLD
ncbi:MAG: hypothetical protein ABIP51_20655 [Bacteroidia bacterium]